MRRITRESSAWTIEEAQSSKQTGTISASTGQTSRWLREHASAAALNIILTGDIIEDTFKNQLEFKAPEIRYSAYPYGNLEDLLGAKVVFQAQYNAAAGYSLQAVLSNAVSGY